MADAGNGFGSSCASDMITAQQIPLDIYVMLDQSSSMSDDNKWTSVTDARSATFVAQPGLDGISIGLGYFAVQTPPPSCSTRRLHDVDTDCGSARVRARASAQTDRSCLGASASIAAGATRAHVDRLRDACRRDRAAARRRPRAITCSMGMHSPTTGTPTVQALTGALPHATSRGRSAHAGDAVVVVLATDGEPDDAARPKTSRASKSVATMGAAGSPEVLTFVIGVGDDLSNLDGIAAAGGTGSAFIVDTSANVIQQFLDAMNTIRHSVLGCTYQIPLPSSGTPDYQEVNVIYTPGGGGSPETIPNVASAAHVPGDRQRLVLRQPVEPDRRSSLCSPTCSVVEADTTGSVAIQLGCSDRDPVVHWKPHAGLVSDRQRSALIVAVDESCRGSG